MPVAPPRPKGPPLNALRAFEAAARLGGFARAAAELCVTPGAVTQHIKGLEAWAGAPLFERRTQGVALTALGRAVLGDFSEAFDQIGRAVVKLRAEAAPGVIHIAALPSIAQLWLTPRLPAIRAVLPGVAISVTALEAPPNLAREPFDVSLFLRARGGMPLEADEIFPVCAPALAARLRAPQDLAGVPCLSDTAWAADWKAWLESAAPGCGVVPSGPVFSLYSMAVDEALAGVGVLIGHAPLIRDHLARGALVAPFAQRLATGRFLSAETLAPVAPGSVRARVMALLRGAG